MDFNELNLETVQIEEGDLDALLAGTLPESTPHAGALPHATEVPPLETPELENTNVDLDTLLSETTEETEEEEEEVEEDKKPKKKTPKTETEEKPVEDKSTKKTKSDEVDETALKQITDFYIQSGQWKDFEGREEFEYNAENFQELLIEQNKEIAKQEFDKILNEVGEVGKTIINHIQNGGKPQDVLNLFIEKENITSYEPITDDEKKSYIAQYYKNVLGLEVNQIKKFINAAEVDGELDDEVKSIKEKYNKHYEKEFEKVEENRKIHAERQRELQEKFNNDVTTEIQSRKDLSDRDKKNLKDLLLNYDEVLPDGTKVSKFYVKFAEMQNNTKDYIDFVEFVADKEKFLSKIRKQEETKATDKVFLKIKGNRAVDTKTGSSHTSVTANKEITEFKWF